MRESLVSRLILLVRILAVLGQEYFPGPGTLRDHSLSPRRILGGYEVQKHALPWQVSLRRRNRHHCGGCLISNELVVTAAHCLIKVRKRGNGIVVRVGSLFRERGGTLIPAERIVWHEDYDPDENFHDIGLVFLKKSLVFSPSVRPLFLPSAFMEIPAGLGVISSGWGTVTYPVKTHPDVLFALDMEVLGNNQCSDILGPEMGINDEHICAYSGAKGRGTCQGDSGGPLSFGDTLLGIASWGIPCAEGVPDVFVKVSYYIGWILSEQLEYVIENEATYSDDYSSEEWDRK